MSDSAGFTLIELLIVMAIALILSTVSIGLYNNFVQRARETSVIVFLRYVHKAQVEHAFNDDDSGYTRKFDDLEALGSIPESVGKTVIKVGKSKRILDDYAITLDKISGKWFAWAEPVDLNTEHRWFYIDETGVSRFEHGKKANATSPKL